VVATYVFHFVLFGVLATRIGWASCSSTSPPRSPALRRRPGQGERVRLGHVRHAVRIVGRQRGDGRLADDPGEIRLGYPRHFAGAVEAASSTGGQITPRSWAPPRS